LNTNNNINKFYSKIEQVTNILFMDKKATLYLCLDFLGKLKILSSCKCLSMGWISHLKIDSQYCPHDVPFFKRLILYIKKVIWSEVSINCNDFVGLSNDIIFIFLQPLSSE
jgi:hypothetical protein